VPDERFDWLCEHYKPKSQVPANLTVYDIAGLTRGASTGAGLGNAFLSHIRAVDAIFQVVRCFDDAEIIHVEGDVDPVRDLDIISEELRIKDIEFVEKALESLQKLTRRGGQSLEMKKMKEEMATVEKILQHLKDGKDVRKGNWGPKEVGRLFLFRLSLLPSRDSMMNKSASSILIPALRMPQLLTTRRNEKKSNPEHLPIAHLFLGKLP
jgi:obg-like ATPase 1